MNHLSAQGFDAKFDTMPLPVLLQLREVLCALFRHLLLIDLVFVLSYGTPHLNLISELMEG
jgi:hypothetical protein